MRDAQPLSRWPACPHPDTCQQGEHCTCRSEMACTTGPDAGPLPPMSRAERAMVLIIYAASAALIIMLLGYAYGKWVTA